MRPRSLRDIELEVEAEGRGWTRQRSRQRLQEEAGRHGGAPLTGRTAVHRRTRPMSLRTRSGAVGLSVLHGQDPDDRHRGCPIRERWGLGNHQQLSFAFQDKLAFTATATASYADAAALAEKRGSPVSAMTDGWTVRQRGLGWGKKKTKEKRVERRGWKTGVCFQMERCVRTKGERGMITDTRVTGWQGDPVGSGVRLHREAMRAGLLSRQPTPVGSRQGVGRGGRGESPCMGRTPATPVADGWAEEGAGRARRIEMQGGRERDGGEKGAGALRRTRASDGAPDDSPERLADWIRGRGIRLPAEAVPVQEAGPISDGHGDEESRCIDQGPSQSPLGRTSDRSLIGGSVKMRPAAGPA